MSEAVRRVGIVGIGNVGKAAASAILHENIADELYISDIDTERAKGEAFDFADSIELTPSRTRVAEVPLAGLAVCDVILVAVTERKKVISDSRLELLKGSAAITYDIVPKLRKAGFKGKYVIATNPCDIITYLFYKLSGLPKNHVIGTGTALDSMRFRRLLSKAIGNVDPRSINAFMVGEHGDSQIAAWSHVTVGGQPLDQFEADNADVFPKINREEVEDAARHFGWEIHKRKGNTQFGIGNELAFFARSILNDARIVTAASVVQNGEYGQHDLAIGVPIVLGRNGVEKIIRYQLSEKEWEGFSASADLIKRYTTQTLEEHQEPAVN
ncbi:L-lactate dehydrogenase [Sporolactobacillus sp. CPB3-1]|uniref:L-lactate dehydrogenase n=1 Tax=Sporolactobacillus mangiferae TaxID=2940498 RepID=A0ABT0MEL0_9BACL|nr:L-lactate dehydrogenase [Sporolactobacillus mangiferae]MCL1632704.1 L-lactate dehydrogenase [Sporolactobacillus mangiferae]